MEKHFEHTLVSAEEAATLEQRYRTGGNVLERAGYSILFATFPAFLIQTLDMLHAIAYGKAYPLTLTQIVMVDTLLACIGIAMCRVGTRLKKRAHEWEPLSEWEHDAITTLSQLDSEIAHVFRPSLDADRELQRRDLTACLAWLKSPYGRRAWN